MDDDIYDELRTRALSITRADIDPDHSDASILAVVMDMGFPEGTATVVGLVDGTTSLYHSGGGGIIGGGEHEQIADATQRWVATAAELADVLEPAGECPLPAPEQVQFVVITPEGRRRAVVPEDELGAGDHALSPLFYAGHDVIGELRLVEEARDEP